MGDAARPRIAIDGCRAAFSGPSLDLAPHRNAVATIALGLETAFRLTIDGGPPAEHTAALIPPGTLHHLQSDGAMAFVYLDPLRDAEGASVDLDAGRRRLLRNGIDDVDLRTLCRVMGLAVPTEPTESFAAVIRAVDRHPQDFPRVEDAARLAGLSASRFRHRFRQVTGVPFKRYRLWRRMAVVATVLADGRSLTRAAHDAGFASSAHLSTAFREMFGIPPSKVVGLNARFELPSD